MSGRRTERALPFRSRGRRTPDGDRATLPESTDGAVDTDAVLERPMTMTYSPPGAFGVGNDDNRGGGE
jgi:hypothetical protein